MSYVCKFVEVKIRIVDNLIKFLFRICYLNASVSSSLKILSQFAAVVKWRRGISSPSNN